MVDDQGPKIVCLCGSTTHQDAFNDALFTETLAGNIVLTIGVNIRLMKGKFDGKTPEELKDIQDKLSKLHFKKIDISDEILVLNVGGYIGEHTSREIIYARERGINIRYLENRDF